MARRLFYFRTVDKADGFCEGVNWINDPNVRLVRRYVETKTGLWVCIFEDDDLDKDINCEMLEEG